MVGVGGVKEITIRALKSGTGKFQAMNSRPWEFKGWEGFVGSSYNSLDIPVTIVGDGKVEPNLSKEAPSMLQVAKLDLNAKDLEIDAVTELDFDEDTFNFGDDDLELDDNSFAVPTMDTEKPIQELNLDLSSGQAKSPWWTQGNYMPKTGDRNLSNEKQTGLKTNWWHGGQV